MGVEDDDVPEFKTIAPRRALDNEDLSPSVSRDAGHTITGGWYGRSDVRAIKEPDGTIKTSWVIPAAVCRRLEGGKTVLVVEVKVGLEGIERIGVYAPRYRIGDDG